MTLGSLFVDGAFTSHSGVRLPFKIDCDALTAADIDCCAREIARRYGPFSRAIGVPGGGLRLADALNVLCAASGTGSIERHRARQFLNYVVDGPTLIVDDDGLKRRAARYSVLVHTRRDPRRGDLHDVEIRHDRTETI